MFWMVFGVIILAILVTVLVIIDKAKRAGLGTMLKMAKEADLTSQLTPKSVSGGDSIFLPLILKDYPEFDVELAKNQVEATVCRLLNFGDTSPLDDRFADFGALLKKQYQGERVSGIKVHRTAISNYVKTKDMATVTFQTAFQFRKGEYTVQERFQTEYALYFDVKSLTNDQSTVSLRCSYCGAPLEELGTKFCTYCGNAVSVMQDRAWCIHSVGVR